MVEIYVNGVVDVCLWLSWFGKVVVAFVCVQVCLIRVRGYGCKINRKDLYAVYEFIMF